MSITPIWWLLAAVCALVVVWTVLGARRRGLGTARWWRATLVLLMIGAITLQPVLGEDDGVDPPAGLDVLLVIDRTTSMGAEDWDGERPRIEGVAHDVEQLVSELGAARWSVIAHDNLARVAMPWTTDSSAVLTMARTMGWREESHGTGSDVAVAAPLAEELLADVAAQRPDSKRLLVYFGDGEQTSPEPPTSFAPLQPYLDGALVLGYGTEEGGRMRQRPDVEDLVTRGGVPQLSHIDHDSLQRMADELGGTYEYRTAPNALASGLPAPAVAVVDETDPRFPLSGLLALVALVPIGWDVFGTLRAWRLARREIEQ